MARELIKLIICNTMINQYSHSQENYVMTYISLAGNYRDDDTAAGCLLTSPAQSHSGQVSTYQPRTITQRPGVYLLASPTQSHSGRVSTYQPRTITQRPDVYLPAPHNHTAAGCLLTSPAQSHSGQVSTYQPRTITQRPGVYLPAPHNHTAAGCLLTSPAHQHFGNIFNTRHQLRRPKRSIVHVVVTHV